MSEFAEGLPRRRFLQQAVASAAALGAFGLAARAPANAVAGKRRLAMVGTGSRGIGMWGTPLVKDYADLLEFVGLCDINPDRSKVARELIGTTAPTFTDFEEMVRATRPDTVIVTTVDGVHAPYVCQAMKMGCDVICEKPLCTRADQARAIRDMQKKTGRDLTVTFNVRHSNSAMKMNVYGRNGQFRHPHCRVCAFKDRCAFHWDITASPRNMKLYVECEARDGYFRDACVFRNSVDIPDTMTVQIRYANEVLVNYSLNAAAPYEGQFVVINGSKGRIELRHDFPSPGRRSVEAEGRDAGRADEFAGRHRRVHVDRPEGAGADRRPGEAGLRWPELDTGPGLGHIHGSRRHAAKHEVNMNRIGIVTVMAGAFAVAASAQQAGHFLDQAVATELLRGAVAGQAVNALAQSADMQRSYVTGVIEQELAQEAARRGLTERVDVQQAMTRARHQILLQALQQDIGRHAVQPTDVEIQASFKKEKDRWVMPEAFKLDIFAADSSNATAVAALKAAAGMAAPDAAALKTAGARQLASGAGEAWVTEREIVPEVWKALPSLRVGEGRTFGVQSAVWLVRRVDARKAGPMTFEQAREQVRGALLQANQRAEWEAFVEKRRKALGL
ncbi:MAG: hypothetical protein BWK77_01215 [Verrucomicrobia bacterium A1]|nr:MAG: hypothetical protein BWK77_01215 [Verrucomicrobia bacterium A1]